jgi:hypothetical protein
MDRPASGSALDDPVFHGSELLKPGDAATRRRAECAAEDTQLPALAVGFIALLVDLNTFD